MLLMLHPHTHTFLHTTSINPTSMPSLSWHGIMCLVRGNGRAAACFAALGGAGWRHSTAEANCRN